MNYDITAPGAMRERQPRHRTLKAAKICYNNRFVTIPCVVRDLSEGGARLSTPTSVSVPDAFELNIEMEGSWIGCEVAWRCADAVGVKFTTAPTVEHRKRVQVVQPIAAAARPSLRRVPKTPAAG